MGSTAQTTCDRGSTGHFSSVFAAAFDEEYPACEPLLRCSPRSRPELVECAPTGLRQGMVGESQGLATAPM